MMDFGGQTDEEKMGIKYLQIAEMIETGKTENKNAEEEIVKRFNNSQHKREKAPIYIFDRKNFLIDKNKF